MSTTKKFFTGGQNVDNDKSEQVLNKCRSNNIKQRDGQSTATCLKKVNNHFNVFI